MKRLLVVVLACVLAHAAYADGVVEAVGGGAFPLGDARWKVGPTYNIGIRAGWTQRDGFGVLVQGDWTPERPTSDGQTFVESEPEIPPSSLRLDRFRVLGDATYRRHLGTTVTMEGRIGLGVDIIRVGHQGGLVPPFGETEAGTHVMTDANIAAEAGVGVWWKLGDRLALGAEIAVPFSHHAHPHDILAPSFGWPGQPLAQLYQAEYTSWDLVAQLGLRVTFGGASSR